MTIRVLSATDVDAALSPALAVDAMRTAFSELSKGSAIVPIRGHLTTDLGTVLLMPAYLGDSQGLGAKIVSVFPANSEHGVPAIQGAVLLLDADTGTVRAVLDGTRLTAIRTAAGSGLATELLADSDSDVLAIFGAGVQARAHVEILAGTRTLREIRIVSRSNDSAVRLADELTGRPEVLLPAGSSASPPMIRAVEHPSEALEGAGLVVAGTTSTTPVFDSDDLEQGAHVNAVGSFRPDMQEVDAKLVQRARVVVDQRAAIWEEAGDLIQPLEAGLIREDIIDAELGEILNGDAPRGRGGFDLTYFKSVGNAAQDVAIAGMALEGAERLGLGIVVEF